MIMPDGSRSPTGYLKWTKTWITHEYERPGALWGINRKNYNNITIPDRAYENENEKIKIEKLLKELEKFHQQDFPISIDNEFSIIAFNKISNNPVKYWVTYPLIRAIRMWTNPFSSFGWPNEMPDSGLSKNERLEAASGNKNIIIQKALEYPIHAISKGLNALYRFTLMIIFIFGLYYVFIKKTDKNLRFIGLMTISYLISRTIFFSFNSNFETRYMLTTTPFIELFTILILISIFKDRKNLF